jgi:hypothetical protein
MTFVNTDEVVIVWQSEHALSASVRDGNGIADCRWSGSGWTCSRCPEPGPCVHVLAVQAIARVAS